MKITYENAEVRGHGVFRCTGEDFPEGRYRVAVQRASDHKFLGNSRSWSGHKVFFPVESRRERGELVLLLGPELVDYLDVKENFRIHVQPEDEGCVFVAQTDVQGILYSGNGSSPPAPQDDVPPEAPWGYGRPGSMPGGHRPDHELEELQKRLQEAEERANAAQAALHQTLRAAAEQEELRRRAEEQAHAAQAALDQTLKAAAEQEELRRKAEERERSMQFALDRLRGTATEQENLRKAAEERARAAQAALDRLRGTVAEQEELRRQAEERARAAQAAKAPTFAQRWEKLLLRGLVALLSLVLLAAVLHSCDEWTWNQSSQGTPQYKTYVNSMGMRFVRLPAGTFTMGSLYGANVPEDEQPQHTVRISRPFYLGQYEVTQAQWERVMGFNPSMFKGANRPVENVSWDDAQEFIEKMNALEGHRRYRLPTEAEWEYAARAGATTRYFFGNSADSLGNYAWDSENSAGTTHPVGGKRPNPWGLYDMYGNVWEWVQDWYDPDAYGDGAAQRDPQGPPTGTHRVNRGCSWGSEVEQGRCRSADRGHLKPNARFGHGGFRLAASVE